MKRWRELCATALLAMGVNACSTQQSEIESAQFHLDRAQYAEAIAILEPIVAADATNLKATSLLASAYFGRGFLGDSESYLGVFGQFLEGQEAGRSNMESIESATPAAAASGQGDIFAAEDLLRGIATASRTQENYLQLGFTQLAIIAVVGVANIGALSTEDPCELDFSVLDGEDAARFDRALDEVSDNFTQAGIDDFATTELGQQIAQMNSDLDAAADLATFLQSEFGALVCP